VGSGCHLGFKSSKHSNFFTGTKSNDSSASTVVLVDPIGEPNVFPTQGSDYFFSKKACFT
jgi:hypothetical protein